MHTINNPFQQNSVTYCLELQIKFAYLQYFVDFFETLSNSVVFFEAEETTCIESQPDDLWQLEAYLDYIPELTELQKKVALIAKEHNITAPLLKSRKIEDCDWVSKVQKTFVPINAGNFFIHNSDYVGTIPENKIPIKIDAGRAFGTGEHETTSNCLIALSELSKNKYINCLDMGCGSGILAIAMAKLWPYQITAVDLDEQAVLTTKENIHLNKVGFITVEESEGYNSKLVQNNSSYQIITANILAGPLIEMAQDAYNCLQEKGILILAGFLKNQMPSVIEAHTKLGFTLIKEIVQESWPALILQK